ncbi:MAG: hypothetical protein ACREYF_09920 [Gammaproteobacteria bacterium]
MTLRVEIELQILEARTLALTPGAPRILDEVGDTTPERCGGTTRVDHALVADWPPEERLSSL